MIFTKKIAKLEDIYIIEELIEKSIRGLLRPLLTKDELEASFESMGLDDQLIKDGTYFLIYKGNDLVGCGGWSKRKTLFGSNYTPNRDSNFLDPKEDAAKIRAMYTHPEWSRRGVGSFILKLAESELKKDGYVRSELMATQAGIPLYINNGYKGVEEMIYESSNGKVVKMLKMVKLFT